MDVIIYVRYLVLYKKKKIERVDANIIESCSIT